MLSPDQDWHVRPHAAMLAATVVSAVLASLPVRARVAPAPVFHLQSSPTGEIALDAREVPITQALEALADEAGFDVSVYHAMVRPPVNLTLPMAPVERVLRELLRGRNYALVYDADTRALRKVILLAPPSSSPSRASARPPARAPARRPVGKRAPAPIVIRN